MLVAVIYMIRFYNTSELKYVSQCRIRESPETIVDRLNGKYDEQKKSIGTRRGHTAGRTGGGRRSDSDA